MRPLLPAVYGCLRLWVPGPADAEDVLQEAMLAVWNGLKGYRGDAAFKTWMLGIVKRKANDHYRAAYRCQTTALDEDTPAPADATPIDERLDLRQAVARLAPWERELLQLVFDMGLTLAEAAELMEIPPGTAKSRMHAIRHKLRLQLMEGDGHGSL